MSVWAPLKLPDSVGGVRVPRRTRETPLTLRLAGLGWLSESLGSAEALSGSVHSQAVFTAANGPREVSVSLRHPAMCGYTKFTQPVAAMAATRLATPEEKVKVWKSNPQGAALLAAKVERIDVTGYVLLHQDASEFLH